jgi:flagellar FliL protein
MAEETQTQNETAVAPKSSQKNPLVTLLLIINIAALATVAYFQYTFMQKEAAKPDLAHLLSEHQANRSTTDEAKIIEEIKKERLLPLEGFTVNLAQGDGPRRFVRLNAVLKMSENSIVDEFEARKPQIRDTIISILNSKRPEDLIKREGKAYLKEEIKAAINAFLVDGKVVDVYYVGFQIN